ncbi:MAG TPA: hypothetical protein VK578_09195 [Edaphobacter sp.]|nr:hypothetical protein [Edaphobacter sp.]
MPLDFSNISELANQTTTTETQPSTAPITGDSQPVPSAVDWQALYLEQKEQTDLLQNVITAARIGQSSNPANKDAKPAITAERFKRMVDPVEFLRMTRDNKLRGLGIDPASITDETLRQLFGRGNDGKLAGDLSKSNLGRYYLLKEAALVLNIYGA